LKIKKYVSFVLVIMLCITSITCIKVTKAYSASDYTVEMKRLESLGILDSSRDSQNGSQSQITREEFAKALVVSSGLEDNANNLMGATIYSDVDTDSAYSGYISAAVNKGLMTGMSDGMFHPTEGINYAQAYTIVVKSLGYTNDDLPGLWPKNYLIKAKQLGLVNGISLSNSDKLPRWAAAVMINRLLNTNIKKVNQTDADKTFADVSGISSDSYQYALISNPVYSEPEVVNNFNPQLSTKIGDIDVGTSAKIVKDGQQVDITKIEDNDVIYEVKDLSGTKRYILDVDNKIQGEITALTGKTIQIGGKDYSLSSNSVFNKITNSTTGFKVGDSVNVLLGYDGKVVDYFDIMGQDNSNFAFVVNYTDNVKDYTVKLLMIDGVTRTYKVSSNPWYKKGKLVGYKMLDSETVELTDLSYSNPGDVVIDKENRKIGDSYVAHNVKIFSLMAGGTTLSSDADVELVKWSDLPSGKVSSDRIQFLNTSGAFGDINVVVINDVFGENYKTAVVKSVNYRTTNGYDINGNLNQVFSGYTLLIDGKEYSYSTSISGATGGSVLKVKLSSSGGIETISEIRSAAASPVKADAIDLTRIMINSTVYGIKVSVQVYFRDWAGGFTLKTIDDIVAGKEYSSVSIYLDKPLLYGGKVDTIIVQ